ncbi:putative HAD superfamily Cof-like phosphohydrolase [Enterococcus sp. PF1-24]|uniref:HAD family hydrolase n=1 Tax=unclassified Enterococcus TaxID=2608891 RepID=UPI0024763BF4|nr:MULTISPECIES: HAD family hydrolase [unclassified Enterococcus]MDH6365720.1 putative HAD superfamily Cof-like phosphohydrolase [Enterococcus sp. PFB1-1]MDH6402822.1 putative HAD superfamily Cof-like phosphohydrolase [Enterococcus sp. PF1-24]
MGKIRNPFEMTEAFHDLFGPEKPATPIAFSKENAGFRAGFKVEELVEFLYAAADNDATVFTELIEGLHENVETAKNKVLAKNEAVADVLVGEVDALVDLLYFTYGSFTLLGVDPTKIFEIVHEANMNKCFPDGKPHYHPVTNKVLKPDNWQAEFAPETKIAKEIARQQAGK